MDVYIRKMTADDIDQVRSLYISGWQNAFKGIGPQDYLDNMNLDEWAPPLDGAYILTDGKDILGTSSVFFMESGAPPTKCGRQGSD